MARFSCDPIHPMEGFRNALWSAVCVCVRGVVNRLCLGYCDTSPQAMQFMEVFLRLLGLAHPSHSL